MDADYTHTRVLTPAATHTAVPSELGHVVVGEFVVPVSLDPRPRSMGGILSTGLSLEAVVEAGIPTP